MGTSVGGHITGINPLLNVNRQEILFDHWRKLRGRCYDMWMDELDNEPLMEAQERLREVVSRCSTRIIAGGNHIDVARTCHEEIAVRWSQCLEHRKIKATTAESSAAAAK